MSETVSADAAAAFRRFCRSSPWRWESLRYSLEWLAPEESAPQQPSPGSTADNPTTAHARSHAPSSPTPLPRVNAWLRRPDALRVEDPEGHVLFSTTTINASKDDFYVAATRASWLLPPKLVQPVYGHDGLVNRRPEAQYGDPLFGDGRWAALLDPVEFAGNAPVPLEFPLSNVVEILELREATHEGRPAAEAVLAPNKTYHPAFADHPLLDEGRALVRIDRETSVCVYLRHLDGSRAGAGHSMSIHAVDEYMLDDLFVERESVLTDVRDHIPWVVRRH